MSDDQGILVLTTESDGCVSRKVKLAGRRAATELTSTKEKVLGSCLICRSRVVGRDSVGEPDASSTIVFGDANANIHDVLMASWKAALLKSLNKG